jgi:hypothetical protein
MKRFLWLGLLLLSASWLFLIPQFTAPDMLLGIIFLILGILCMIGGVWRVAPKSIDMKYVLVIIPLILALLIVPSPYNLSVAVLAFGLLLTPVFTKIKTTLAIPFGIIISGVILLLHTLVFPLYMVFVSHGHRVDILSPLISFVGGFLGLHTSTNNGIVFIQTIQQTYPFTITWEKLGLYLWLNMFLGVLLIFVFLYEKRRILRYIIIFLVTSFLYIVLRFVAVLYWYLTTAELSVFWDPVIMILSFLPFALLLMKLISFKEGTEGITKLPAFVFSKKQLAALFLMFLLVFSSTGLFLFQDPGTIKDGRVLIDEYHSQWEDTIRPLDTEWYGLLSTYNYYSWAQWLSCYFDVEKNTDRVLTSELLSNYDILILKCPTESYTTQEIQDIRRFVDTGGGLYLIGDHTNVFGMNTFLNQVSEQFGIRYNTDATYELGTGDLSIFQPDRLFAHPVMRHVTRFDFMTSCTLEPTSLVASATMENIIIGNKISSEPGTYSTENFFRESVSSPDSEYGYLLQAAAMRYGAGRVVAFTDSTVFSSFSVFTDGYPAFTLITLQYLNRMNSSGYLSLLFVCLALVSLALLLVLLRQTHKIQVVWITLFAGLLAFSFALPLFSSYIDVSYPLPDIQTDYPQVCFEQQHSSCNISVKPTAVLGENQNDYGTFFVWTQRVGYVPSIVTTVADAVEKGDLIVFINPTSSFTESEIQQVTTYLENDGRVLVMDSITNTDSTANELIGNFGVWISVNTNEYPLSENDEGNRSNSSIGNITSPYVALTGGTQVLVDPRNETHVSVVDIVNKTTGAMGKLVVVVDSYTFSDTVMGGTFTEPTERQRQIYETEFFLLTQVLTL